MLLLDTNVLFDGKKSKERKERNEEKKSRFLNIRTDKFLHLGQESKNKFLQGIISKILR